MNVVRLGVCLVLCAAVGATLAAQGAPPRKRLLVIGEEKGYRHEAVSHAMVTIERLGRETGLWDTVIRTDTEALTKKKLEYNAKNLNDFDAVVFYTGGTLEMDDQKKADFISFVHVLMRLDAGKLDLNNPSVHRKDHDFAVTWAKMYGKGRVFYTTLGHVEANWDKPEMQTMFTEAITWVLGLVDADVTPRPAASIPSRDR